MHIVQLVELLQPAHEEPNPRVRHRASAHNPRVAEEGLAAVVQLKLREHLRAANVSSLATTQAAYAPCQRTRAARASSSRGAQRARESNPAWWRCENKHVLERRAHSTTGLPVEALSKLGRKRLAVVDDLRAHTTFEPGQAATPRRTLNTAASLPSARFWMVFSWLSSTTGMSTLSKRGKLTTCTCGHAQ